MYSQMSVGGYGLGPVSSLRFCQSHRINWVLIKSAKTLKCFLKVLFEIVWKHFVKIGWWVSFSTYEGRRMLSSESTLFIKKRKDHLGFRYYSNSRVDFALSSFIIQFVFFRVKYSLLVSCYKNRPEQKWYSRNSVALLVFCHYNEMLGTRVLLAYPFGSSRMWCLSGFCQVRASIGSRSIYCVPVITWGRETSEARFRLENKFILWPLPSYYLRISH